MTSRPMLLPASHFPKAQTYVRALRRALVDYWYATIEDTEAATIEAARAAIVVNILDEAVFLGAFGDRYRRQRGNSRLGRVVMGLELVRNCETHSPHVAEGLLVRSGLFGVPSSRCGTIMRSVYRWAEYADLPSPYRELASSATQTQQRARAEAQDGYRKAVQGRPVTETIFDALAFFHSLDGRLVGAVGPPTRWAFAEQGFAELPDTDPRFEQPTAWLLARPMGMDQFEPYLPDLACRHFERRTALWPAADDVMKQRVAQAKKQAPAGQAREVGFVIRTDDATLGYGGYSASDGATRSTWVERRAQVWRDVHRGFRYFVVRDGTEIDLRCHGHQQVGAFDAGAHDVLVDLPVAIEGLDAARLKMVEEYPDLYLEMRTRL